MTFPSDDRYVRFNFSDSKRVAGLLREFLDQEIVSLLDLDQLVRIHDQHIASTLREHRDDLNLQCPLRNGGGTVLVRVIVEHKSEHAPQLWLQLMRTICAEWERGGFSAILPVVLHTGLAPFDFETPQTNLNELPKPLLMTLPSMNVHPIDLFTCSMERIWDSKHLDHVSKVGLTILKAAQNCKKDIITIRKMLKEHWPDISEIRKRRYIYAAINYIKFKSNLTAEEFKELSLDMIRVHSINPNSPLAQELREERQKGLEQGLEKGTDINQVASITNMLAEGDMDWPKITRITGVTQTEWPALQARVK